MNELQAALLAADNNSDAMKNAIQTGVFFGAATMLSMGSYSLSVTEIGGVNFPQLYATEQEVDRIIDEEIEDHKRCAREAVESGDLEDFDEDEEDDLDLVLVEVQWDGGDTMSIDGCPPVLWTKLATGAST